MSTYFLKGATALTLVSTALTAAATAQDRIAITIENLAPRSGTFQTPVWFGLHSGSFDSYDRGVEVAGPTSPLGDDSLERLAEDGATGFIAANFLASQAGTVEGTIPGPNGPIAPGDRAFAAHLVDPQDATSRYFSYASMVLPSNDAFIANGDPLAHPVFDSTGAFVFQDFINQAVLDAGSEVNDELPVSTAFFGQSAPNTGVDEGGVVAFHPGFNAPGTGGILDDFRYRNGDFTLPGYSPVMVRIRRAPAITEDRAYAGLATGLNQVPAVQTPAVARVAAITMDDGARMRVVFAGRNIINVVAAHLHLGAAGTNGPVVAGLLEGLIPMPGPFGGDVMIMEITGAELTGPLADYPLDALVAQLELGNVYFNLHTSDGNPATSGAPGDNPGGEIRAQLARQ